MCFYEAFNALCPRQADKIRQRAAELNHMELVTLNVFKSKIAALESRYYRI